MSGAVRPAQRLSQTWTSSRISCFPRPLIAKNTAFSRSPSVPIYSVSNSTRRHQSAMATENQKALESGNEKYASSFEKGNLPTAPAKKLAILTCMDSRIDIFPAFGLNLGDAHIIRNAGGNVKDGLRSILISQHFLGTREVIVIKHTSCGMLTFSNAEALARIAKSNGTGVIESTYDFQPFSDLEQSVKDDVEFLRNNKALVKDTKVSGYIYDVDTGKVRHVI